jgi:mRNA interferase RelE/StbE
MYGITYSRAATRVLRRIPANTASLIREKVIELAADPKAPRSNVRVLKGRDELRLRVGNWRILYAIDEAEETIRVRPIAPRGSAYR